MEKIQISGYACDHNGRIYNNVFRWSQFIKSLMF